MKRMGALMCVLAGCLVLSACSSTRTVADIAADVAKADKVREEADRARLERKQSLMEERLNATPKWALEPMRIDGEAVYAVGFGESDKANVALKKAMLEAEFGLAKKYKQELSGQERSGVSDKGERSLSQSYSQLIDSLVASVPMAGAEVVEQEVKAVQGQVSVWVLMRMSHDQMQKMARVEGGAAEDARMKAAFADLEKRVRDRRDEQLRIEERRQEMRLREMKAGAEITQQAAQGTEAAQGAKAK